MKEPFVEPSLTQDPHFLINLALTVHDPMQPVSLIHPSIPEQVLPSSLEAVVPELSRVLLSVGESPHPSSMHLILDEPPIVHTPVHEVQLTLPFPHPIHETPVVQITLSELEDP